ncbi:hypothetical protein Q1W73_12705 [Asticcacaulis sp. ZE23SCel15]|uniref:hypothetical protein n=1 Tax=Asticcacaulis sp. ZE23SCel15 TaxID=3059027 RepID=UPI00265ED872|nr:hypothetical protein [Asticcacaulis sp. ZE23SCel15]WKL56540.1 hypothetical protein Q1W73_12705 [Asticcacaulis sp. ZE23SCel15]
MNTRQGKRRPPRYAPELIEDARVLFQNQYGHPVNTEEARQMLDNLVGFFKTLHLWRHAQLKMAAAGIVRDNVEIETAPDLTPEPPENTVRETNATVGVNEGLETGLYAHSDRMRRRRFRSTKQKTEPT